MKNIPERIRTGIRNTTIPFYTEEYVGHPSQYQFNKVQQANYQAISEVIGQAGIELTVLGVERSGGNLLRFVAYAGDPNNPDFVWQKYEANVTGAGQNYVFVAGERMQTTSFLRMDRFKAIMMCMKTKDASADYLKGA